MSSPKPYREQALKLLPWLCTRCAREFPASRLRELTVHHKDGDHDHNPADGSNWELLCIYCHENEHARVTDAKPGGGAKQPPTATATHKPLEGLADLVKNRKKNLSVHSITRSARTRKECGNTSPIALAVFRFRTSSNLVGCSIGRSPGFAPLRILST